MLYTAMTGKRAEELNAVEIQEMNPASRPKKENLVRMMEAYQTGGKAAFLDEWDKIFPQDKLSSQDRAELLKGEPSKKS